MTNRIIIPTEEKSGLDAHLAQHFGRAPYYTIVDLDEKNNNVGVRTEVNKGEHVGGTGHPHEHLLALKPNVIIAHAMGPGGIKSFQNAKIIVLKANANTVKEIVESFKQGKLTELTGGCEHAHHHEHER